MKKYDRFKDSPELIESITEELSEDQRLKQFFIDNDIPSETIEESLNDLLTYREEIKRCENCPGLHACTQDTLGIQPVLSYRREKIHLEYKPCSYMKAKLKKRRDNKRINALFMPQMIYDATLEDFYMNTNERQDLYKRIIGITNQYASGETIKGLYLHGRYQIGKTYALAAIANRFSELGQSVSVVYYPDLVREIKSAIKTGEVEQRVNQLKTVDVLLLDDIGGEAFSAWVRDEVLGPILQYRLLDNKPTFFSSNVPPDELGKYYVSNDQQQEKIKGYRIIERIKKLADAFNMK